MPPPPLQIWLFATIARSSRLYASLWENARKEKGLAIIPHSLAGREEPGTSRDSVQKVRSMAVDGAQKREANPREPNKIISELFDA